MNSLCAFVISIAAFSAGWQAEEPVLNARTVVEEAPAKWAEYKSKTRGLQGSVVMKRTVDGKETTLAQWQFKQNQQCKMQMTVFKSSGRESIWAKCENPSYAIELRKKSADKEWVLADLQKPRKENYVTTSRVQDLVFLHPTGLESLLSQASFRITRIAMADQYGPGFYRIDFENAHPLDAERGPGEDFCPIQGGSIVLDATHFWCLRSADLEVEYAGFKARSQIEYEYHVSAGVPIPKKVTEKMAIPPSKETGEAVQVLTETIHELVIGQPEDFEFTLSAFGLPEPLGILSDRKPRYNLWLISGGIAVLAVAAVWHWRRRLARQSAKAEP